MKNYLLVFVLSGFLLFGCANGGSEQDFFDKTSAQAAGTAIGNGEFELNNFIAGTWKGRCGEAAKTDQLLQFGNDARLKVTYAAPPDSTEHSSAYEQGLYEILSEKSIRLHFLAIGEVVEINKISNDEIKIGGNGTSILYGCTLRRVKADVL